MRLRVDLSYDGSAFSGWARQPGRRTVQGELESALRTVLRLDHVALVCAGRTDAGVHAHGQVAHVDLPEDRLEPMTTQSAEPSWSVLRHRLDALTGDDVVVRSVTVAPDGFDARFSALWRRYGYRVCDDPRSRDPLLRHHVLTVPRRLDVESMNTAAQRLLGEHDFAAFCRRREGASTVRELYALRWRREEAADRSAPAHPDTARDSVTDSPVLVADIVADAFCHNMVRSLVGALLLVGEGVRPVEWPAQVLAAAVRDPSVRVVAAHALTLEQVAYPDDSELRARADATRRLRVPRS